MKQIESKKRVFVLCLGLIGLLMQTLVYGWFWFNVYYPIVNAPRSAGGYDVGPGLHLYFRGHLLVIALYFVLVLFLSNTYGGLKIGYLKAMDIFLSQIFALLMVNIISYFQISLFGIRLVPVYPMLEVLAIQLVISFLWAVFTNWLYRSIFPARKMLLVSGEYPVDDILRKFNSRQDKYLIKTG